MDFCDVVVKDEAHHVEFSRNKETGREKEGRKKKDRERGSEGER